jgi:RNA polymerase sigma-70 factor, ECF subfamily
MSLKRKGAFEAFITPHLPDLRRTALRLCRNTNEAEDLVQDVCLRALEVLDELPGIASPRSWLFRVQYNLHVDKQRQRPCAPHDPLANDSDASAIVALTPAPEASAETTALLESLNRVWPLLNRDQQALLAFYAEGYSLKEITAMTGLPITALKTRLHRARVRLGRLIKADSGPMTRAAAVGEPR